MHELDGIKKGFLAVELNIWISLPGYSHGCQLCYGWDSWHIHVCHLFSETWREEGGPANFQWCKLDIHDFAPVRSFLSIHCCPWTNTELLSLNYPSSYSPAERTIKQSSATESLGVPAGRILFKSLVWDFLCLRQFLAHSMQFSFVASVSVRLLRVCWSVHCPSCCCLWLPESCRNSFIITMFHFLEVACCNTDLLNMQWCRWCSNWIIPFKHVCRSDGVSWMGLVCPHCNSWKLLLNLGGIELILHLLKSINTIYGMIRDLDWSPLCCFPCDATLKA